MNPTELKEALVSQHQEAIVNLHRLEGAISALTKLEESEEVSSPSPSESNEN